MEDIMKKNKNVKEITIKIEGKEWEDALDKAFEKANKKVKIDGFRQGKAPKEVFIKKYGEESLFMDAADLVLQPAYQKMLDENKDVEIVAQPEVALKSISKDGVEFVFTITTKPEVKLGKYKKLGVKKEKVEVTKEEIENALNETLNRYAENVVKDGKVENGDIAIIDFEGFKDGKAFDGGKGENYSLVIGSNTFIPGFEDALIGMQVNEEKDIDLTFPENYHSEELKGAKVVFKVKINSIKERILPEYNEEFFKDLNMEGVTDYESLKNNVMEHIKGHKTAEIEDKYFDECLSKVSEEAKMDVPEEMINEEVDRITNEFSQRLSYQGMNIDTYLKMLNTDIDTFKANFKPEAEKRVKYRLVIEQVVKAEDIKVNDKEVDDYSKEMANKYGVDESEFLSQIGGKEFLKYDLEVRKAIEIITK
jgi:trigger factor